MMMRMLAVIAMSVVHEQMHQRAGQQEQIRQYSQQVRTVFGDEKEGGNRQKCNQDPVESSRGTMYIMPGRLIMFHHVLLKENSGAISFRMGFTMFQIIVLK